MKLEASSQHSPPSRSVHRLGGQLLANVEQKDATTFRRVAHEVHDVAAGDEPHIGHVALRLRAHHVGLDCVAAHRGRPGVRLRAVKASRRARLVQNLRAVKILYEELARGADPEGHGRAVAAGVSRLHACRREGGTKFGS